MSEIEGSMSKTDYEILAKANWNNFADRYNQWDSLGQDEKDELIAKAQKV